MARSSFSGGASAGTNVITVSEEDGIVLDAPDDVVSIGDYNGENNETMVIINDTATVISMTAANARIALNRNAGEVEIGDIEGNDTGAAITVNAPADRIRLNASKIMVEDIPTADPEVAGQLWNDAGTLKVSAG